MTALLGHLSPDGYRAHPLHSPERCWPETNCYLDLWIELLHALGLPPEAALTCTARQDFEGDQFGFTKIPLNELESLYGLRVQELALYQPPEDHLERQAERGRMCLIEVDPFYLPDTGPAAYRVKHGKTTVGVNVLDRAGRRLEYFHNAGYFALEGEDFEGLFRPAPEGCAPWRPYVEYTTLEPARLDPGELKRRCARLLDHHWSRRPAQNPIRAFQSVVVEQASRIGDEAGFHDFAFHNPRLLGANFELLGACLAWLSNGTDARIELCRTIAEGAKAWQFQLARAVARRRFDSLPAGLDSAALAWDALFDQQAARDAA